jgi:hypothetical protein
MNSTPEAVQFIGVPVVSIDECLSPHIPEFTSLSWADAADYLDYHDY